MSLALEYGYTAFHKHGEELCGDNVAVADKDGYLTLTYHELIAPLYALVQEQEKRIETLEKQLKGGDQ